MAELWLAFCAILGMAFGLLVFLSSRRKEEEEAIEGLMEEWDVQDHLEEVAEEEELLLEEEQDTQDLMDLVYLDEDEDEEVC